MNVAVSIHLPRKVMIDIFATESYGHCENNLISY